MQSQISINALWNLPLL